MIKLFYLLIAKRKQSDPYRSIKIERARKEVFRFNPPKLKAMP